MRYLRWLIREMLAEDEVLGEPDESAEDDREKDEQSAVPAIAGATTPLGTGPNYPDKKRRTNKKNT